MEHYHKAESHKYTTPPEQHEIRIGQRHRIKEVVTKALRYLADEEKKKVRLSGQGPTITKTVTCCEIVKRKVPAAHQITDIFYTTVEDIWEPNDPEKDLDRLKVTTRTPAIRILLSHEPLDPDTPGYQGPLAAKRKALHHGHKSRGRSSHQSVEAGGDFKSSKGCGKRGGEAGKRKGGHEKAGEGKEGEQVASTDSQPPQSGQPAKVARRKEQRKRQSSQQSET